MPAKRRIPTHVVAEKRGIPADESGSDPKAHSLCPSPSAFWLTEPLVPNTGLCNWCLRCLQPIHKDSFQYVTRRIIFTTNLQKVSHQGSGFPILLRTDGT